MQIPTDKYMKPHIHTPANTYGNRKQFLFKKKKLSLQYVYVRDY